MKKILILSLLSLSIGLTLSGRVLEPLTEKNSSGGYLFKAEPAEGDGSLGSHFKPLPNDEVPVGVNPKGEGLAYLIAFETTDEDRQMMTWLHNNQQTATFKLPLVGKTWEGIPAKVILLGGTEKLADNQWARFGAWNVANGYTILGEIPAGKDKEVLEFPLDWNGKGVTAKRPVCWIAVFVPLDAGKDSNGNHAQYKFSGSANAMPVIELK